MCARLIKPKRPKATRTYNKETGKYESKKPTKAEMDSYHKALKDYNDQILTNRQRRADMVGKFSEGRTERAKIRAGSRKTLYAASAVNELGDNYEKGQKNAQTVVNNYNSNVNNNGTTTVDEKGPWTKDPGKPQKPEGISEDSLVESPPESGLSTNPPTANENTDKADSSNKKKKAGKNSWSYRWAGLMKLRNGSPLSDHPLASTSRIYLEPK